MLRQFTDANGTTWRVWDVWPRNSRTSTSAAHPGLEVFPGANLSDGWLCFECDREKRRLAPVPPEWETCEPCVLEDLCARAGFITPTPASTERQQD